MNTNGMMQPVRQRHIQSHYYVNFNLLVCSKYYKTELCKQVRFLLSGSQIKIIEIFWGHSEDVQGIANIAKRNSSNENDCAYY